VRGGAGIFYRRFTTDAGLLVNRQNGVLEQEYVVVSPQFCPGTQGTAATGCPGAPTAGQLANAAAMPTVYKVSPNFRAPALVEESMGIDRHIGRILTIGATYNGVRAVHTQLTENENAPLPGTYAIGNTASGIRPYGNENIYEYVSEGLYRSNQLSTNMTVRSSRITAYGSYALQYAHSDAESNGVFPTNIYDLGADYGRSLGDVRHRASVGVDTELPFGFRSWANVQAASGAPFNILVGQDLNGDSQFNDRPAFATDLTRASVVATKFGTFDTNPVAGQTIIPRNYGQGPGLFLVNLAVGRDFGIGPRLTGRNLTGGKAPGARKYVAELWVETQNLLNHPNLTPPVGYLDSPLFGHSIGVTGGSSLTSDREIDLQLSLRF
jgi:hypothetical protein